MTIRVLTLAIAITSLVSTSVAVADDYLPAPWWPSEWGPDDQRGALNRLTPERIAAAARLIKNGRVFDLGQVFEEDMPLFALTPQRRKYTLTVPGAPSWGPLGDNKLVWNEDYIAGHLSQDGTQFDSLSHMGTAMGDPANLGEIRYYNGHKHKDIGTGRGFTKLGQEHVTPIFTRGVLLDFVKLKGRVLECSEELSVDDIKAALELQGLAENTIQPGDGAARMMVSASADSSSFAAFSSRRYFSSERRPRSRTAAANASTTAATWAGSRLATMVVKTSARNMK